MEKRAMKQEIIDLVTEKESEADVERKKRASWRLTSAGQVSPELLDYLQELDAWARKVRRDILVIEYHLKEGVNPADFYGDPGDPPPPPDEL